MRYACRVMALALLCLPYSARGEVPQHFMLNLQIFEPDAPFGFSYEGPLKAELFDAAEGGNSLWYETSADVTIDYGFMSVPLGLVNIVTPLAEILTENSQVALFLEITLGGTGEILPERIELTSVPFALVCSMAESAHTLAGKTVDEFAMVDHGHTIAGITDWPATFPPAQHDHGDVYLPAGGKAADADFLDGMDSAEFVSAGQLVGVEADLATNYYTASQLDTGQLDGRYYTKQQCEEVFAPKGETYTKVQVDNAIAEAVTVALGPVEAQLWCLTNCDPAKLMDCQDRECNGVAESCTESDPLPDGTVCQAGSGVGACKDGVCWQSVLVMCGETQCPGLAGYTVTCNVKDHCEYANLSDDSSWKQWDVWIYIPPGTFQMGSEGEGGNSDETPVHQVTISYGYFISKYEAVVEQYQECNLEQPGKCTIPSTTTNDIGGWGTNYWEDGTDPADGANVLHQRLDHPQNGLTWQQSKDYCAWSAPGGRLPSEAEWEYAATGPTHMKFPWGNSPEPSCLDNNAVFNDAGQGYGCGQGGTWPVGSKPDGSSWCGAMDMVGNVWEWNEDWFHNTYTNAPNDGSAWVEPTSSKRVFRGGSFFCSGNNLRTADRCDNPPGNRCANNGVRCLRPLP
jgi:formylglycine-generating enzyme required for sulfatase activity